MKLPNAAHAEVAKSKVVDYLLAIEHPQGADKAYYFHRFGFSANRWQDFADALHQQAVSHNVTNTVETEFGICYRVDGQIETPDGRNPRISTVRQIDWGEATPRLLTAYPFER